MPIDDKAKPVSEGSVSRQIRAVKEGSSRTRAEAMEKLFPGLRQRAHRMAHAKLRGTGADSEVAAASAARRTLADVQSGEVETANRKQLLGLLTQRAFDKSNEMLRKSFAKKRGAKVTRSLGELVRHEEGGAKEFEIPIPDDAARAAEQELLGRLAAALPADCQAVLRLYLAGFTYAEIGEQVGLSDDAVGRRMKQIEKLGARLVAGDKGGASPA